MIELSREQIIDLLENVIQTKVVQSSKVKDNIQFCCPIHGEKNPSAGVSVSKQVFHCFSCHASGDITWLLYKSLPDKFKSVYEADTFIRERYNIDVEKQNRILHKELKRYEEQFLIDVEEEKEKRFITPKEKLAIFRSGKETYPYFFERGFTKKTAKEFLIGRDIVEKTITIPVFWEDGELCGIIGRYISKDRPKNSRYKIYDFPTGDILFPLNKFEPVDDTVILVEGILDALWLHQLGFKNALATLTNNISYKQAGIVRRYAKKVVDMSDNDEMGKIASEMYKKKLKGLIIYDVKQFYPEGKKDPQECSKEEIEFMLTNKTNVLTQRLKNLKGGV